MKRLLLLAAGCLSLIALHAQNATERKDQTQAFGHLDASITAGSTGLGFDLSLPVSSLLQIRAGYAFMPNFSYTVPFTVQVGDTYEQRYDKNGNRHETKFDKMAELLQDITGSTIDDKIDVTGRPSFHNFKLMLDVAPFRNKGWHITAGVFFGPKRIARAYNTAEDMNSLMAVNLYNHIYNKAINGEALANGYDGSLGEALGSIDPAIGNYFRAYGRMAMHVGNYAHDVYYEEDVTETHLEINPVTFLEYPVTTIVHAKGDVKHAKGDPYLMEPNDESMVKARMKVNSVRPYVGFGYGGRLIKGDDRYHISFDAGVLFWGGAPNIIMHDGIDLTRDVTEIGGKLGSYVKLAKAAKCYPVVDLRLTRRFSLGGRHLAHAQHVAQQPETIYVDRIVEKVVEVPAAAQPKVEDDGFVAQSADSVDPAVTQLLEKSTRRREPVRRDVFFKLPSSKISDDEMPNVQDIASFMTAYPSAKVHVIGYSNKSSQFNMQHTDECAHNVCNTLVRDFNIARNRIILLESKVDTELMSDASKIRVSLVAIE